MPGELSGTPEGVGGIKKGVTEQDEEKEKKELARMQEELIIADDELIRANEEMLEKRNILNNAEKAFNTLLDELRKKDARELTDEQLEKLRQYNLVIEPAIYDYREARGEVTKSFNKFFALEIEIRRYFAIQKKTIY